MVRTISILGSTGSIGVNALEVISNLKKSFKVKYLSTNKNVDLGTEVQLTATSTFYTNAVFDSNVNKFLVLYCKIKFIFIF